MFTKINKKIAVLVAVIVSGLVALILFTTNNPLLPATSFVTHECFETVDFYQFNSYNIFSTTTNAYLRVLPEGQASYFATDSNNLINDYRSGVLDQQQMKQLLSFVAQKPSDKSNIAHATKAAWSSSAKSVVGGKFTIVYDINIHDLLLEIGETLETRELDDGVYLRAVINHYPARSDSDADLRNLSCDQDPLQSFVAAVASEQQLVPFPEGLDVALINQIPNRFVFLARLNHLQSIPFHLVRKSGEDVIEVMPMLNDSEESAETATSTTEVITEEIDREDHHFSLSCAPIDSWKIPQNWRTFSKVF